MPPIRQVRIADPPETQVFQGEADFDALMQVLRQLNDSTLLQPILSADDVMLADNGRTLTGDYRLSYLAMRQMCTGVAAGLSVLVADISGLRRTATRVDQIISVPTAARIFNMCVNLRFQMQNGLYNRQLVVDTDKHRIDGVLGAGYRYLPHAELVLAVDEAMQGLPERTSFSSATLYGRHLTAIWQQDEPLFVGPNNKPVYSGYYITNSEAGECSVAAAVTMLFDNYRALLTVNSGNRIAHAGKSFSKRLVKLIGDMLVTSDQMRERASKLSTLARVPLNLIDASGKLRRAHAARIVDKLARLGVRRDIAADVVEAVIMGGGSGAPRPELPAEASRRTAYDLFVRLCRVAATYSYEVREPVEKAAFRLLSSNIRFE